MKIVNQHNILLMVQKSQTTTQHVGTPVNIEIFTISTRAVFLPSTVALNPHEAE